MATDDRNDANESAPAADSTLSPKREQHNGDSQTASDYINSQLQLEADAREALPYSFERCTQPLGVLRQNVYACLTCNPPDDPSKPFKPTGVCYACSIACHGNHTLVELFARRNFTCDCGTTRFPSTSPCTLRIDPATGLNGPVHSQEPAPGNTYNKNFANRFCGCGDLYDAHRQKGTMYQCLGLATEQEGGCGEDWWHPECLLGLPHDWYESDHKNPTKENREAREEVNGATDGDQDAVDEEHPVPPGFPDEDDFATLICYKCVEASPWIKRYGNSKGFMPKHFRSSSVKDEMDVTDQGAAQAPDQPMPDLVTDEAATQPVQESKKRKAEDDASESGSTGSKKAKLEEEEPSTEQQIHASLPQPPSGVFSILAEDDEFRTHFCRCAECYPTLAKYPQLLEEEETYVPPESEAGDAQGGSVGTGSLLERGEAALSNVDRVRAIEGVMVYNHLRDKVKSFLQPFAESGQAVGAEDIKAYFEKLRGDHEAIRAAGGIAATGSGDDASGGDNRREQSGY